MSEKKTVVIIHETALQSWLRDAGTFLTVSGIICLGWFLDSTAMQWAGFVMAFIVILARAAGARHGVHRTDLAGARKVLDDLEDSQ